MNSSAEISWLEVRKIHQKSGSIYAEDGFIVSLLCNEISKIQDCSNVFTFDTKSPDYIPQLTRAFQNKHAFKVFRKIEKNKWFYDGMYKVSSVEIISNRYYFKISKT